MKRPNATYTQIKPDIVLDQISLLVFTGKVSVTFDENGYPMMYVFKNCKAFIRTLPTLIYDEHKVEDLDTEGEDHQADEARYFCMMRPIAPRVTEIKERPQHDPLNQFVERGSYNKAIFRRI